VHASHVAYRLVLEKSTEIFCINTESPLSLGLLVILDVFVEHYHHAVMFVVLSIVSLFRAFAVVRGKDV